MQNPTRRRREKANIVFLQNSEEEKKRKRYKKKLKFYLFIKTMNIVKKKNIFKPENENFIEHSS